MPIEVSELRIPGQEAALGDSVPDVNRLTVRFGHTVIFAGPNLTVACGDALAAIGPNGYGKTLLFRSLIGAIPYEGTRPSGPIAVAIAGGLFFLSLLKSWRLSGTLWMCPIPRKSMSRNPAH